MATERYGVFEIRIQGPSEGNPFLEHQIQGVFKGPEGTVKMPGFYDGAGIYKVRFMPSYEGTYTYEITADFLKSPVTGTETVTPAGPGNHGPVRVDHQYHFAYEDGTPHYSIGTTCYAFAHQTEALKEQTYKTLKEGPFNKIRFCVLPKHYIHNLKDPQTFPFEGTPCDRSWINEFNFSYQLEVTDNDFDYDRFNPIHFQKLDEAVERLMELGIEADLIIMHPYDCWGFSKMTPEQDDRYWRYCIARFASYRNVWWSLANEWDLMPQKSVSEWEHYAELLVTLDPYHHLRSIHNCRTMYDHARPWVTHLSVQRIDVYKSTELGTELREKFGKPVVFDEIAYEGNIDQGWGNITGEELTRRFWEAAMRGTYPGHGETYLDPEDILWWSHGGTLHGTSPARIQFLKQILEETPGYGLREVQGMWDETAAAPETSDGYKIFYYGFNRPSFRDLMLPEGSWQIEVIDTWDMTITDQGVHTGRTRVQLPAKQYMAIRIRKVEA